MTKGQKPQPGSHSVFPSNAKEGKGSLIGPFREIITLDRAPLKGPLQHRDLGRIVDGGVLVSPTGRIIQVGDFNVLSHEYKPPEYQLNYIEGDKVLLPGFIDAHTHVLFGGTRSRDYSMRLEGKTYLEIAQAGGGIMDTVRATRQTEDILLARTMEARLIQMHQAGITTAEVKTGYGLTPGEELRLLRLLHQLQNNPRLEYIDLVTTCLAAHMNPPDGSFAGQNLAYLMDITESLLPTVKKEKLCNRVDIFVEDTAFTVDQARKYLQTAGQMGFDRTVHADQFTTGGVLLAIESGAVSADHLEAITPEEIRALAASETVATVLPGASMGLGIPFAPARQLLDAGCILAVASDWNPGSAPMGDLLTQLAMLSVYEKLSMAEAFAAVSFRAAAALRLSERGRIRAGYLADMQAFDTNDYREILYHQGRLKPAIIWKKSKQYDQ